MKVRRRCR